MKKILFLSCLFLGQIAFCQTAKLTKVSGTKCSLMPPDGFTASTTFSGFQNVETGASIMINELPAPYLTLVNGFTADALMSRGMTLIDKKTIDFNGSKATFISLTQPANGAIYVKQMLIFGDSASTVLINGIYPEAAKEIEPKIKEALLSTVYDVSQDDNPLEAASFTVNVDSTDFKIVKYISGALLYSTDGKIPTQKPTLIVANSFSKIPIQNKKGYAEERLKKLPGGELSVIRETKDISIDDLNGFEILADGKTKDGKAELIYQVMLFDESDNYFLIVGQSQEDFEKYLAHFKKIAKTFKRK